MRIMRELQALGFIFRLDGEAIHFEHRGEVKPNPNTVNPLLAELKKRKAEAASYLQREKAWGVIHQWGWAAIQSGVLGGEIILWTQDSKTVVPARWNDAVRYTIDELKELFNKNGKVTPEELRQIHQAKKLFGGTVVQSMT